ncbi:MAG TPA: Trm112 family protein, partial [Thermoanaerobaculia bacterium]|nr:Trm112 family protein [Thermoanaerobaculia bacterium]
MHRRLLDWLVCPDCGAPLRLEARTEEGAEVVEGTLACACGRSYPVSAGIPRMLAGASGP